MISPIEISSPLLIRSPFILTSNKAFQGHYSCSTHQLRPFACHFIWKMGDACAHDSASARYFILLIISTIYINNKKTKTPLKSTKLILSVSFKNSTPPILFTKALQLFKTKKKKTSKMSLPLEEWIFQFHPIPMDRSTATELDTVCFETLPLTWRLFDHHKGLEHLGSSHHPPNVGSSSAETTKENCDDLTNIK